MGLDAWVEREDETDEIACHLGNATKIQSLRATLELHVAQLPILIGAVLHSGTHGGDDIDLNDVFRLQSELHFLATVHSEEPDDECSIRDLENKLRALVAAAIRLRRPICF
jgi:hypothetical protein